MISDRDDKTLMLEYYKSARALPSSLKQHAFTTIIRWE